MKVNIDGYDFETEGVREGILIDPVLPEGFEHTPNDERPVSHDGFWQRPYIDTAGYREHGFVVVCCLDGGAWDRPTLHGRFQSVEEAVRYIKSDFSPYRGQEVRQLENFRIFGVGGRSPYPACAEGAVLDIGPGGINLVLSMTKPSKAEIRAIRTGRMQIGMIMYGTIAVLLWRFHDRKGRKIAEFDSIFHIGLLPPEKRQVPFRPDGSRHQVLIVLQNERATCRALRRVSLPADVSETIDAVAAAQAAQTARPDWSPASHRAEVEAYFSDFPTPAHAFALTDSPAFMGGRDGRF